MASMTDYLETALLNLVLRNTAFSPPSEIYLAAYTVMPTESTTGTEVSTGGYVRQAVTFGAPASGVAANTTAVVFPVATVDWGTVVGTALLDASTGGNMLFYAPLPLAKPIVVGDIFRINVGDVTVAFN